ncbi:MAG: MFS transporter, partial [Myxococcota bacterium]
MNRFRRALVVVALLVGTFLASLDVMVVGTAMPTIIADLGGLPLYGWVFAAYLLTSTTTVPVYGKLADRWGRKPTFLVGATVFLVGSVACGMAPTMIALIVARGVQGMGAGAIIPMTMTIFGDLFPVEQRVKLQGAFSVVWGVSSVLGPVVGGAIVEHWPWPWVFYINLPIGVVSCALLAWALKEDVPRREARIDWSGAVLLTAAITCLLLGLTLLEQQRFVLAGALVVISPALGAAFIAVERKAEDPVVPLSLFRDKVISVSTASGVFIGGVLFPTVAFLPLLMRGAYGESPMRAGAAVTPLSLTWTVATFTASRIILKAGYRPTIVSGSVCLVIGAALSAGAPWFDIQWLAIAGAATPSSAAPPAPA